MPEMVEVEHYRRLAEQALARSISGIDAPDAWFLKRATTPGALRAALVGHALGAARRIGKLLLLEVIETDGSPRDARMATVGLRFGMTGRLVVDDVAGVDELLYTSRRDDPKWHRFAVRFADGGSMVVSDPRRLGGVELDPDVSRLGIDASEISPAATRVVFEASDAPLKARLMDQSRIAGVGNLIADEVLWRAGLDPARPSRSLTRAEHRRLHTHLRATIADLLERGGSHTGDLMAERGRGGRCPRDGELLARRTIGGRTTFSCPRHQR